MLHEDPFWGMSTATVFPDASTCLILPRRIGCRDLVGGCSVHAIDPLEDEEDCSLQTRD